MSLPSLIQSLLNPAIYPHPCREMQLIQTHISWVVLTGDYAYKIKKPVTLPFLDFSELSQRAYFCQQELMLNQRFAPELYLSVVAITGEVSAPVLNGSGAAIEYAVKMKQFAPDAPLSVFIQQHELPPKLIDQLADQIAAFHSTCAVYTGENFGSSASILHDTWGNLLQLGELLPSELQNNLLTLKRWTQQQFDLLKETFVQRQQAGFVRNGHGDLHLGNMALIDNHIALFDCIEFNEAFRWIDMINDLAFLLMDLFAHQQASAAHRLLDRYLQRTGDYAGLAVLRFYLVYRALIRAKVAMLSHQTEQAHTYVQLALQFTQVVAPKLILTCGVSGSGKSAISQPLLEQCGLIRIRSDVERKRLFGLALEQKSTGKNIYQSSVSQQTYQHLRQLAGVIIAAGYGVIIDATNLKKQHRTPFFTLAQQLAVPFCQLHFYARPEVLRAWIHERQQQGVDASEADVSVMVQQLEEFEPFDEVEQIYSRSFNSESLDAAQRVIEFVQHQDGFLPSEIVINQ